MNRMIKVNYEAGRGFILGELKPGSHVTLGYMKPARFDCFRATLAALDRNRDANKGQLSSETVLRIWAQFIRPAGQED